MLDTNALSKVLTFEDKSKMCLYERMEHYESTEKDRSFNYKKSILAVRVVIKNFRKFHKVWNQPFDMQHIEFMKATADVLLKSFKGSYAHVSNNDITMIIHGTETSDIPFGGKKQRLVSNISSAAASFYSVKLVENKDVERLYKLGCYPIFETTVFELPNKAEAANVLLWRERDTTKECLINISQFLGLEKELMNKTFPSRLEMITAREDYSWEALETVFKTGLFLKRVTRFCEKRDRLKQVTEPDDVKFGNVTIDNRIARIFD